MSDPIMPIAPITPVTPMTAVMHPDPYSYYRELVEQKPFYYDEDLKLWIASSADVVTEVLANNMCRVRPLNEPVPKALTGSPAGLIFGNLARMNDGQKHHSLKQAVINSSERIDLNTVASLSRKSAQILYETIKPDEDLSKLSAFAFNLPVNVMASVLGVPEEQIPEMYDPIKDLVECFAPGATADQIDRGKTAAGRLLNSFDRYLSEMTGKSEGLLFTLARGCGDKVLAAANAIGFMTQAYEATAGLIGNTLAALAAHENIRQRIELEPELLPALVEEIVRYDAPVQNTRRFAADDLEIAGQRIKNGEAILVILAAANHDKAVNPCPERLDIFRKERRCFTFGAGVHACPGQMPAQTIACAGVRQILNSEIELSRLAGKFKYRRSANTRIPLFQN
jgi:cytochrome P450